MTRTLRDARLDTREARSRLRVQGKPHWRLLEPGLHLGYRRLAKRPGTWCVRRYVGGQTYTVETLKGVVADDFANADGKTVLDFKQAQREVLKHKPKAAGALTVADAVEQYLAYLTENAKSADDYRYRADALILPSLGGIAVADLTTEKLRGWLSTLAKSPAKRRAHEGGTEPLRRRRSTANRTLTILKAALNLAFREGHAPADGAWRRVRPFRGVDAARLRYLKVAEAQRLINACDADLRQLVQAALQTGARYGELARLRVHDFNPDSNTVTVRQSKSGKPRHLFLTDEGAALFRRWCTGKPGNALLFIRNGQPWGKSNQCRPMLLACERAKIDPPIGFHTLRHTWASLSVMASMPLIVVARNLGHADTKMCERHYAHLSPSYEADSIRKHAPVFGFEPDDQKVTALRVRS
ncbi:MAG TPA: site-specific integrase [Xanthobacteraceae bacterium]|nr:site-specific integrase [Xanthobacteraceae bacterium]